MVINVGQSKPDSAPRSLAAHFRADEGVERWLLPKVGLLDPREVIRRSFCRPDRSSAAGGHFSPDSEVLNRGELLQDGSGGWLPHAAKVLPQNDSCALVQRHTASVLVYRCV